jgi:hypothetical protein
MKRFSSLLKVTLGFADKPNVSTLSPSADLLLDAAMAPPTTTERSKDRRHFLDWF